MKLVALLLAALAFTSCDRLRGSGYWEVTLHDVDTNKALTFQRMPGSTKDLTVVFLTEKSGVLKPRNYRLPKDGEKMPDTKVTFSDTTMLPGRVTLLSGGHEIDVMERALFVDGVEYSWDRTVPIEVK